MFFPSCSPPQLHFLSFARENLKSCYSLLQTPNMLNLNSVANIPMILPHTDNTLFHLFIYICISNGIPWKYSTKLHRDAKAKCAATS